ncbi:CCAAT/enhancer-binding protein zeta [Sarcoptes scabiei]|uniref:CCAAT/enhancer-binding protein zeta n=1 Tax=Sarcoptes scabiei TaxID=52283 RepID=A0A834RFX9_SARSC|nr:CCAAT/enhancer-binding protein zeta [Sarcoptes scabiei]
MTDRINRRFQGKSTLIIPIGSKWFHKRSNSNSFDHRSGKPNQLDRARIEQLKADAIKLWEQDRNLYEKLKKNNPKKTDFEWIQDVLSRGTINDKLAAYTVLIQDSSVHNVHYIGRLVRFVNVKDKRACLAALDTIQDLFIGDLLRPKHKLLSFEESIASVDEKFLSIGSDENSMIRDNFLLLAYIEDQIRSYYREFLDRLVTCSHDSLEMLRKKSIQILSNLLISNPEGEKFLLTNLVNKLGDPQPKIASNTIKLLTDVLANHPSMKMIVVKEVERLLFRPNSSNRVQYYCLCFLSSIIFKVEVDREVANQIINIYFLMFTKLAKLGEVNVKMMSILLTGLSRAFPYSKLSNEVVQDNLDKLYKILRFVTLNTAIQALSLIFNMVKFCENNSLNDKYYLVLYKFLHQPGLDQCNKLSLLLNVIYRSIKIDPIQKRAKAFVKRILQLALIANPSFIIAVLIMISELLKVKTGFKIRVTVIDQGTENLEESSRSQSRTDLPKFEDLDSQIQNYRLGAENPMLSNAEFEPYWELAALRKHFHPTVRLYAQNLLEENSFAYDGDPLEDFSLKRFLERFSFKNPKHNNPSKSKADLKQVFRKNRSSGQSKFTIDNIISQDEKDIPNSELYIHRYLQQRKLFAKADENEPIESDLESVDSVEFNDLLDHYEQNNGNHLEEIDYAKDIHSNYGKKSRNSNVDADDIEEEFEYNEEDLEELKGFDSDVSDEDVDLDDVDEDSDLDIGTIDFKIKKPNNVAPFKGKKKFSSFTNDIFASAEDFDYILNQDEFKFDRDSERDDCRGKKSHNKKAKRVQKIKTKKKNIDL